jgi:hypothetical protein
MFFIIKFKNRELQVSEIYRSIETELICEIKHGAFYRDVLNYEFEGELISYNDK